MRNRSLPDREKQSRLFLLKPFPQDAAKRSAIGGHQPTLAQHAPFCWDVRNSLAKFFAILIGEDVPKLTKAGRRRFIKAVKGDFCRSVMQSSVSQLVTVELQEIRMTSGPLAQRGLIFSSQDAVAFLQQSLDCRIIEQGDSDQFQCVVEGRGQAAILVHQV